MVAGGRRGAPAADEERENEQTENSERHGHEGCHLRGLSLGFHHDALAVALFVDVENLLVGFPFGDHTGDVGLHLESHFAAVGSDGFLIAAGRVHGVLDPVDS